MTDKVVTNLYTLNYDLGNGRQIQINGNFTEGQSLVERNASLDEVIDVVERQRARLSIELLELRVKQQIKQLEDTLDQLQSLQQRIAAPGAHDKKMALRGQRDQLTVNVRHLKESIAAGQKEVEDARKFVETGERAA